MAQNRIDILIKATDQASSEIRSVSDELERSAETSKRADKAFSDFSGRALTVGAAGLAALATGAIAATKASWDQVGAVEQATVGLRAYEKDGAKVNSVLKDLISYARSDMGVLFNRKDLFESAQSLKLMGDNTDDLVGHVQILSRSVGLGLSTWDTLNEVVGRVGKTGRLAGDDFDNLSKAGFSLDSSLRNTNITYDELFKALDRGIPAEALNGQANTIKGAGIRMETAFRSVGDAILGVDKETSKFIEGGLGSRLVGGIQTATAALRWLSSNFETVRSVLGTTAAGLTAFVLVQNATTIATTSLAVAQGALNAVMRLNPLALVAGAAVSIITAYMGVVTQSDSASNAATRLKTAQDALRVSTDAAKAAQDALRGALLSQEGAALAVERAQLNYNSAVLQYGPNSLQAREAAFALKGANDQLANATNGVASATRNATAAEQEKARARDAVVAANTASGNSAAQAAGGYIALASAIRQAKDQDARQGTGITASSNAALGIKGHAIGTSYAPGGQTLVGENGPEIVNLPRGSQVFPNYQSRQMAGGGETTNVYENGTYNFYTAEAVEAHERARDKTQRMARYGMAA